MGLFNRKNKNTKQKQLSAIFKEQGYTVNTGKAPEPMTRKEAKVAQVAQQEQGTRKDVILNELNKLRKEMMYAGGGFETLIDDVTSMQELVRRVDEGTDKAALTSVDSLLLEVIKNANSHCRRGNFYAVRASMRIIKGYIIAREKASPYYANPDYIAAQLEYDSKYVEIEMLNMEREQLSAEAKQLPFYVSQGYIPEREAVKRAAELKAAALKIDDQVAHYTNRTQVLADIMNELKKDRVINTGTFDMQAAANQALTIKRNNEYDSTTNDKLHVELNTSHKKVLASTLAVDDSVMDNSSKTSVKLTDEMLDF